MNMYKHVTLTHIKTHTYTPVYNTYTILHSYTEHLNIATSVRPTSGFVHSRIWILFAIILLVLRGEKRDR